MTTVTSMPSQTRVRDPVELAFDSALSKLVAEYLPTERQRAGDELTLQAQHVIITTVDRRADT